MLPSCMTSYDLPVVAGVQYNIAVSALSNGRESQDNPHCNFGMCSALYILMDTSSNLVFNYITIRNRIKITIENMTKDFYFMCS